MVGATAMTNDFDARNFVKDLNDAMNAKNPDKLLPYYATDAELRDPSTVQPLRGHDGVRKNLQQWSGAFSEVKMNVREIYGSGDKIAILLDVSGRHTGELELAPGEVVPATNKTARTEMAEFLTIQNGKIVKDVGIFDMASLMQQLGLMPDPQAASGAGKAAAGARRGG